MAAFAANDALVKLVGQGYPSGEVIVVRGLITAAVLGVILVATGPANAMAAFKDPRTLFRSLLDGLAAALFISALMHMPIAEVSAIALVSPLILTGMAVVLHGERIGARRLAAIATGLAGTLLVVQPTPGAFNAWGLLALLCAFVAAGRDLITRNLSPTVSSLAVSLTTSISVTVFGFGMGLWEEWRWMDGANVGLLAVSAVFLAAGNFLLVLAFRGVEIAAVSPYRYFLLIWASLAGFVLFGEIPDPMAFAGAGLIAAGGVYTFHRERITRQQMAKDGERDGANAETMATGSKV